MVKFPSIERYGRQMLIPAFGVSGQQKLLAAKVLMIGAGGLGCPALQYLVAAGVGTVGIVDHDIVVVSNLHRQVLYSTADIGQSKALRAKAVLEALNPEIQILAYPQQLTPANALGIMRDYDIIIDGTDNFATRYMINDACVLLAKPLVYGAVSRFEGQVAVFNQQDLKTEPSVNYRDLYPQPPDAGTVLNCAEAGVLGVLPGIIGAMQANEAIKLITGIGKPLINRLLTYNALNNEFFEIGLTAYAGTKNLIPCDEVAFGQMDYQLLCGAAR